VRGAYKVRIINGVKFLEKLIGNNVPFQTQFELQKYFESEFQGKTPWLFRYSPGVMPVCFLKKRQKEESVSLP
ncbi:MAG: hypothetical protein IIU04_02005, partial [Bacteroidales bacterium]|nr:hypothetical protein [Bacteroidales bacterium]